MNNNHKLIIETGQITKSHTRYKIEEDVTGGVLWFDIISAWETRICWSWEGPGCQDGGLNYETSKKNQVCHYLCVCFTSMKMKAGEVEKHRKIESSKCVYGFWWWGETQCVGYEEFVERALHESLKQI